MATAFLKSFDCHSVFQNLGLTDSPIDVNVVISSLYTLFKDSFRRFLWLVTAVPTGRESLWPTFSRDITLWMRYVVIYASLCLFPSFLTLTLTNIFF